MDEIKTVDAEIDIEALCKCPYCGSYEDVFDEVKEELNNLRTKDCEIECVCSECGKTFIVKNVTY